MGNLRHLAIQQTKLLTREAGGRIPPYEKGAAKRFWAVKNDWGILERAGVKNTDDDCTACTAVHVIVFGYVHTYPYPYVTMA